MSKLLQPDIRRNSQASFVDQLDASLLPPLPWAAQRIRIRHGLTAAAALVTAREAGFNLNGGR